MQLVLEDKHGNTIDVIRKLAEDVAALPGKLDTVAAAFEDKVGAFGSSVTELRETIADAPGVSTTIGDWLNENTPGFDDRKKAENTPLIAERTDYREEYFQETVFWMHDIGLKQDQETRLPGILSGTIAGDAWEAYANFRNAKTFEAVTRGIAVGATVADAGLDPFGFVGDQIAGWMLTHVEPCRKVLDALKRQDGGGVFRELEPNRQRAGRHEHDVAGGSRGRHRDVYRSSCTDIAIGSGGLTNRRGGSP